MDSTDDLVTPQIDTESALRKLISDYPKMLDKRLQPELDRYCLELISHSVIAVVACNDSSTPMFLLAKDDILVRTPKLLTLPLANKAPAPGSPVNASLYFLVPGIGYALRVNGSIAKTGTLWTMSITCSYLHCARAAARAELWCTDSGTRMIAIGQNAGLSQSNIFGNSIENLYIGDYAGFRTCTSDGNVVVGHFAMCAVGQNAFRNTLFGARAGMYLGCSSNHNTFMGYASGYQLRCSSINNIYIGSFAGYSPTVIDGNTDNIAIGYYAGKNYAGNGNILIGCGMCCTNSTTISERFHLGYGAGNCLLIGCLNSSGRTLCVNGTLSKTAGSFAIPHPNPTKTQACELWHSFVESPTAGDNLYRFEVEVENGQATIDLPDYYKHLNENDQVWVNAKNHFGRAYGVVNQEQTILTVFADQDGEYNVLLIGTRKDKDAVNAWKGTERLKQN
jgi:hypothetical protein